MRFADKAVGTWAAMLIVTGLCDAAGAADSPSAEDQPNYSPHTALASRPGGGPGITFTADYSYVAGADAKFGSASGGDSEAQSLGAAVATTLPLSEQWFMPLGLSTTHHWFGSAGDLPIPDSIHTLRISAGLGYNFNSQWSASISLGPVLYRMDDIEDNDIGVFGLVNVLYRANPDLTWAFGLAANPDSDVPVIPAVGVRWAFQPQWTLNLMFPRPLVIYQAADKLNIFAGGDIRFSVFRTDDDLGDTLGNPRYNDTRATYRDIRAGLGAEYELLPRLWTTIEAGYSVWRQIDFKDRDRSIDFDPSPYVQAGVRYRF